MNAEYRSVEGEVVKCVVWTLEDYNKTFGHGANWTRYFQDDNFFGVIGLTTPRGAKYIATSGTELRIDDKPNGLEVRGVDVFREDADKNGNPVIDVDHYGFFKLDEEVVMPTKPFKEPKVHHLCSIDKFKVLHDESRNYRKNQENLATRNK
jgi:hypothetical protein